MKRIVIFLGFLLSFGFVHSQEKATLNGYVKEASNGETMIGATIYIVETKTGVVTNTYGFYSITIPQGSYTIEYRYIGYQTITKNVDFFTDQRIDIELQEEAREIEEIVIRAERIDHNVTSTEMSVNKLDMKEIQKMPAFLGEVDVIKSIQLRQASR